MEDLGKINSIHLYKLWRNLSVGMLSIVALLAFNRLLPSFLSPVVALLAAAGLYTYIYDNKAKKEVTCMVVPFTFLYSFVIFAFLSILVNIMYAWGWAGWIPNEMIFFDGPFLPTLMLNPICFLTFLYISLRRKTFKVCINCRLQNGDSFDRGALGGILNREAHFQMHNLTVIFGFLSVLVWAYYLVYYVNININSRDWYIFIWITAITFVLDEIYFIARYYNLYLDLKENNEIITPDEIQDMTAKTYMRFYVICGNSMYVDTHAIDPRTPYREVIDTPFFTKRSVNGISIDEVKRIIAKMTGHEGELRFFFGRKSTDMANHSLLRYFYFLDGKHEEYTEMATDGEWYDFDRIKHLYSNNPGKLSDTCVSDISRLATIMLTEKIFDSNGYRKSKIKLYNPTFNLHDVRKSNIDFQDDKWIRISMFNSDTPFYGIKRKWKMLQGQSGK